ncbi:MAG: phosphotransferase [Planctomycetota bacterium]
MGDAPKFDEKSLRELVRERWGEVAALAPCPSYRDLVRRVDLADGDRVLLKIAHPDEDLARLDAQIEALHRAEGAGLPLPRVRPDRHGRARDLVRDASGRECALLALDWIEGDLLADRRERPLAFWRGLGRELARLGAAWVGLDAPVLERDQPWDLGRALFVLDHLSLHEEPEACARVERAAVQFAGRVLARADELPAAVIHGDANEHNLLVVGEGASMRVAGLVDLGDMARTRRVFELAVASAYAIFDALDPVAVVAALVAGWTEVAPLEAAEIEALPAAIAMRLAVSVTASARALRERPGDAYLAVSREGAWRELARLESIAPADFSDALREAAGRPGLHDERPAAVDLLERRRRRLGPSLSLSYREPLVIVGARKLAPRRGGGRTSTPSTTSVTSATPARRWRARSASRRTA